jgi:D-hydroxyproline dehydrogenase
MRQQHVAVDCWSAEAVQRDCTATERADPGGLFFPRTGHFIDPYRVVCELVEAAKQRRDSFSSARSGTAN